MGGNKPVEMTLNHDERNIHKKITDDDGSFLDFPGVVDGEWKQYLKFTFIPRIDFWFAYRPAEDSAAFIDFLWTVQPNWRYWVDEEGYGVGDDMLIVLASRMDHEGHFISPFYVDRLFR